MLKLILLTFIAVLSCRRDVENAPDFSNPGYEDRLNGLESETQTLNDSQKAQKSSLELTAKSFDESMKTVSSCNTYLSALFTNLSSTKAQHLPEWQQMYDALTSGEAINNPDFGLGSENKQTHFYAHQKSIENLNQISEQLSTETTNLALTSESHGKDLNTIHLNIETLNNLNTQQESQQQRRFIDAEKRLETMEAAVTSMNNTVRNLDAVVARVEGRMAVIEELLRKYDIATMDKRIATNEANIKSIDLRTSNLEGRVTTSEGDLINLENSLLDLEVELSKNTTNLGQLTQRVEDIENKL